MLARGLGGFHVHAAEGALGSAVQQVAQRQQGGRLAGLPRRVQHEEALLSDQRQHLAQVHALQRRDAVVIRGDHRSRGVEEAHQR
ncbi:MAG: hypothetical protein OXC31_11945 [Spirochaetaceae bacterium]|nr:hypothetical protein [Spirochaetaceae bacterium]